MRRSVLIVSVLLLLFGCTAAGGLKPTIMTAPIGYLETFPLDRVSEAELITNVGPPDRTITLGGRTGYVYQLGEGFGLRTFTYFLTGGVVTDVLYNDSGPYNGATARTLQHRQ